MIVRRVLLGSRQQIFGQWRRFLSYPAHQVVGLPALSPTMEVGTITNWKVSEGSSFAAGDVICEVETDKATVDFEAQDDGIVAKLLAETGGEISVGTPIMVLVEDEKDIPAFAKYTTSEEGAKPPEAKEEASPTITKGSTSEENPFLYLPSARFLAQSKNIDASSLEGSGKGGRITKGDILYALSAGQKFPQLAQKAAASAPAPKKEEEGSAMPTIETTSTLKKQETHQATTPPSDAHTAKNEPFGVVPPVAFDLSSVPTTNAPYTDTPASTMRKVISKRLTESRQKVPHYYTSIKVELDHVASFRKELQSMFGVKVSVNDIVIRAVALALQDVPRANSSWIDNTAKPNSSIDVSVAVATPTGLITPIVFDANKKGLSAISAEIRSLAKKARDGKLQPHEFQGGTVSVSNLGMFGVSEFSAVINPPQACILAVGSGVPSFKLSDKETLKPQKITTMTSRLSADRRVVDEPTAAAFLQAYAYYVSNPKLLVL